MFYQDIIKWKIDMAIKKIKITSTIPSNFKPISEYKGPILKLTQKDKEEIAKCQKSIASLECDVYDINKKLCQSGLTFGQKEYFYQKLMHLDYHIGILKDAIRDIKINRLQKQAQGKV